MRKRLRIWFLLPIGVGDARPHDEACGFVVIAKDAREARRVASDDCGDEGPDLWLKARRSTCLELTPRSTGGRSEVVLRDYNAG